MRRERYNIYEKAHSKLRRQLLDAGLMVQATDFGRKSEANYAFDKIIETSSTIHQYLGQVKEILEAIITMAPYIVMELEKGNSSIKELVIKTDTIRDQYNQAFTTTLKRKIGNEMQQVFFELTAASLKMMNREEIIVNDLLWTNYTDAEIQELEKRMTAPSFKIDSVNVAVVEQTVPLNKALTPVNITPLISLSDILPGSEKLSMLIRTVLAPGKWSFANRVYNIIRPYHLFGMMPAIITCAIMPVLSA
jgi:hypothetical protein